MGKRAHQVFAMPGALSPPRKYPHSLCVPLRRARSSKACVCARARGRVSICLSACLPASLSACLPACQPVCLPACLSVCVRVRVCPHACVRVRERVWLCCVRLMKGSLRFGSQVHSTPGQHNSIYASEGSFPFQTCPLVSPRRQQANGLNLAGGVPRFALHTKSVSACIRVPCGQHQQQLSSVHPDFRHGVHRMHSEGVRACARVCTLARVCADRWDDAETFLCCGRSNIGSDPVLIRAPGCKFGTLFFVDLAPGMVHMCVCESWRRR